MSKSKIDEIVSLIPDLIEKVGEYFKNSANESVKSVSESSGSIALLIKIFTKPLIDKYFKNKERDKLNLFGIYTYLEASLIQVGHSLEAILTNIKDEYSIDGIIIGFEKEIESEIQNIRNTELVVFFQPSLHPVINEVVSIVEKFLEKIGIDYALVEKFKKHYFEGIDNQIQEVFGPELYKKHIKEIEKYLFKESESKLLLDSVKLGKIGFKETENLNYEETYAEWCPVYSFLNTNTYNRGISFNEIIKKEQSLLKAVDLIDEYFLIESESHLEKILFLIADFGKGKSVFLKHYAFTIAKKYIATGNESLPIYFNLRNFKDYPEDHRFGILGAFLEIKYGIKLTDEYFAKKRYVFLLDSLDECGELTSYNIEKVINSIKKIQNINPTVYKTNRIIVASRPFDEGLKRHLENHKPYIRYNDQGRPIEYYISIYGFKVHQFNNWLSRAILDSPNISVESSYGFNKEILDGVKKNSNYNIYENFLRKEIISYGELKRPIFAYMIFQLLSNSINFDKAGKIGVYLSFLNLLTKDAKYLHDVSYKINLSEQFEARNILHATSAVWLYNRSFSDKSEIKKADICRALEGELSYESDVQVLARYRNSNVSKIEFLSHSYFGEKNNTLHFQHQSFAEILLAEYYLKVLVKFSLDEEFDYEQARVKLSIGDPTKQTIEFLKDLVILLKESLDEKAIEKRKLIFPMLASLATRANNKTLYCNYLYYNWFSRFEFLENDVNYPDDSLSNWPVNERTINKMVDICKKIVTADNNITLQTGEFKTALFNKEVFFSPNFNTTPNIDKWISLLCGNLLYNEEQNRKWFNGSLENATKLLELLYNFTEANIPRWALDFFQGINLSGNRSLIRLNNLNLIGINFSNSILEGVDFQRSILYQANFSNCHLIYCDFTFSYLDEVDFFNSKISHYSRFALSSIEQGLMFPYMLAEYTHDHTDGQFGFSAMYVNYGSDVLHINQIIGEDGIIAMANYLGSLLQDGYRRKLWDRTLIFKSISFDNDSHKEIFRKKITPYLTRSKSTKRKK